MFATLFADTLDRVENSFTPVSARVQCVTSPGCAPRYHFTLTRHMRHGDDCTPHSFETRDARTAAILALCDWSERERFPLVIG